MSAHSRRVFVEFVQMCTFFKTAEKVEKYKYLTSYWQKQSVHGVNNKISKRSRELRLTAASTVHLVWALQNTPDVCCMCEQTKDPLECIVHSHAIPPLPPVPSAFNTPSLRVLPPIIFFHVWSASPSSFPATTLRWPYWLIRLTLVEYISQFILAYL